ncbi:TRAP transporter fused permease subunit [Aestuariivita sp.]|jgi:TRAP transporter 4TM/12TM fusion protein|uniref:TRAP transporter permease n=1 Tax=Aestuariivita sp. TaxID=1872407 RepID=UPI002171785D|nr:TRAP transporter fused permease subunit [Aestuariivita sp.]MCE8009543.1 TRAP transporter fused permease subunit [Aestuariivita sp.]
MPDAITQTKTDPVRHPGDRSLRWSCIAALAVAMTGFHLYTGAFGAFPDLIQRALHVGGTLMLAFLLFGFRGQDARGMPLKLIDALLAALAAFGALYIVFSYDRLMGFTFRANTVDFVLGIVMTLLVLEGCRRVVGWTIPILGLLGLGYALLGPVLPDVIAHRGLDPKLAAEVLYLSNRGLFGMVTGISANVIALFVIYGVFLLRTGGGQTFMDIAMRIGGRSTGGGAKVATISSAMFGSVSGSAAANVATTGAFTIPLMKRLGYRPSFAAAVESVASTGGQIMPPIMGAGAFIMAELLGVSYVSIMVAGLIPAMLYFLGCLAGIHFESLRLGYRPVDAAQMPQLTKVLTLRKAGPVLASLFALIALMVNGYSPALAAFSAIVLLVGLYVIAAESGSDLVRRIKSLGATVIDAGIALVTIAVLIAGAQILLAMISTTGLGVSFTNSIISLGQDRLMLSLILAMLVSMLLGTGLPTAAAYLLAAAVVAPALVRLGIEPIGAHMFIFYFSIIAGLTPPLCATVFIAASMAGTDWVRASLLAVRLSLVAFIIPFVFVFHPELLMSGTAPAIALHSITALIGVIVIGAAMAGYLFGPLRFVERIALAVAAFVLILPGLTMTLIGAGLLGAVVLYHRMRIAKAPPQSQRISPDAKP